MPWSKDGGGKYVSEIVALAPEQPGVVHTILDYGCGLSDLGAVIRQAYPTRTDIRVYGYDPGIPSKEALPEPADIVVCTDVLEHIEPDKLDAVLSHLYSVTKRIAFVVIAMRPADKRLPDGRNAHLIIDNTKWWYDKLFAVGPWKFLIDDYGEGSGMFKLRLRKRN
jgi:hypothetical protein